MTKKLFAYAGRTDDNRVLDWAIFSIGTVSLLGGISAAIFG